jgi:integrase
LLIKEGKTKAARREIPLSDKAFEVLERRLKNAIGNYLFRRDAVRKVRQSQLIKLNNAHNGALKRSGIEKCLLYDLRHTFASRMAMSGCDLVTLAALLGHSRIQMVMR